MRRLALVSVLAASVAALALPAQAHDYHGHGYGHGYGPVGAGAAAGDAVAGFALGTVGGVASAVAPGYDYVDAYRPAPPSNDRYGYAWAPAAEAYAVSYPTGHSYPVGPDCYGVTSGWYGY